MNLKMHELKEYFPHNSKLQLNLFQEYVSHEVTPCCMAPYGAGGAGSPATRRCRRDCLPRTAPHHELRYLE